MASKLLIVGVLAVILGISLAATENAATTTVSLRIAGSNVPSSLMAKWDVDFGTATNGIVNAYYGTQQTGVVKALFTSNAIDFAVVDVPLTTDEKATIEDARGSSIAHAPLAVGGLAIAYSSSLGLTASNPLKLNPTIIAGIFSGAITNWNDAAIVALNPSLAESAEAIRPVIYSGSSGTTYTLTRYLFQEGASSNSASYTITAPSNSFTVTAVSSISSTISGNTGTIGFISYGDASNLLLASLLNKDGAYVQPTTTAFAAAAAVATLPAGTDVWADNLLLSTSTASKNSYPISFFVYAIFNVDQAPAGGVGAATGAFLYWTQTSSPQAKVSEYGFANLSTAALTNNNNTLNALTFASGTATTDYYPYVAPAVTIPVAPTPTSPPTLEKISSSAIQIIIIIVLVVAILLVVAYDQYRGGCIIHCRSTGRGVWA